MFHVLNKSCPYSNWTSETRTHCSNPDDFHCVKDEYNRIGWVCAQPIWVEKDRCPVYNIGAEKMDTTSCIQTRCPPYNYRSNDIDVEYACRYLYVRPTTIPPYTFFNLSTGTDNNNNNNNSPELWIILTALLSLVVVVGVVIAAIVMLYKRRTKSPQNDDIRLEETKDLLKDKADTSNKAKEQSKSFKQAGKHLDQKQMVAITGVQGSGRTKSPQNDDIRLEGAKKLLEDKADTSNKAEEQSQFFKQARKFLDQKRMVVITGVQGSGKTFLAKLLVTDLKNNGTDMKSIWISNIIELQDYQTKSKGEFDICVFDGTFYELQIDEKVKKTIKALKGYLDISKYLYLIFTIPSYIWQKRSRCNEFETWLGEVRVDLDKRSESEKRNILTYLMNRYDVPREQADIICKLESDLLWFTSKSIGFPALISLVCKQSSEDEIKKLLINPLQSMSDKVALLKNDPTIEEGGKFLILAYMSLKDGKLDVDNVDKELFESLKTAFVPGFLDTDLKKDLKKYASKMVGYYLSNEDEGRYEFDLNIMEKIVLVSVAKENVVLVQSHRKIDYPKYVITTELCPDDINDNYAECFAKVR